MATQNKLHLIWASAGGIADPGDTKYATGWVSEIPTFQNFNYVLQVTTNNILARAEKGDYEYQVNIVYQSGVRLHADDRAYYTAIADNLANVWPLTNKGSWTLGALFGDALPSTLLEVEGVKIINVNDRVATLWGGNDQTITNANAIVALNTTGGSDNLLLANVSGEAVIVNTGTQAIPDNRNIALGQPNTHRLFHEGHPPTQGEVAGTIGEAPNDGRLYARQGNGWVLVSTTIISATPPTVNGNSTGWYNTEDGQTYIDLNDGDSSQWVPMSPAKLPDNPGGSAPASFSVADNAVAVLTAPNTAGWLFITEGNANQAPNPSYSKFVWYDVGSSPRLNNIGTQVGGSMDLIFSALTGTTGVDGNLTLGAEGGNIYVENRSGSNKTFTVRYL